MLNPEILRTQAEVSCRMWRSVLLFVIVAFAMSFATSARGASIFDDDWKAPQRSEPKREVHPPATQSVSKPPAAIAGSADIPVKTTRTQTSPRPIPSASDQATKRKLFRELFARELSDSSATSRKQLAERLLNEASRSASEATDEYVLLAAAYEAAKEGQEIGICYKAADAFSEAFEVDGFSLKLLAVAACSKAKDMADAKAAVEAGVNLIDTCLAAGAYEDAAKAATTLSQVADRIQDAKMLASVRERIKYSKSVYNEYIQLRKDFATLRTTPEDGKANLNVGRFYCFLRGDWERGVPFLAHCGDAAIKAVAVAELGASNNEMRLKVADDWWNLAAHQTGTEKHRIEMHAGVTYRDVLESLVGLEKLRVQKRLGELAPFGLMPGTEVEWVHGREPVEMLPASAGIAVLSEIGGGFQGTGEGIGIGIDSGGLWRLSGIASERPHAKAISLRAVASNTMQSPKEFVWKTGDPPVRMIRNEEGFCVFAGLAGGMRGDAEEIRVFPGEDGYWHLQCKSAVKLTVRALAVRFSRPSFPPSFTEYEWSAGEKRVRMLRKDEGFCFLSGVGGKFEGDSERVSVSIDNDGFWQLEGSSKQKNLKARAISLRIDLGSH